MEILHNQSFQSVSWIKSNKSRFEVGQKIETLYYPESLTELEDLIVTLRRNGDDFELIGYSSNTLFSPNHVVSNMVCTKRVNKWSETDTKIICECGVNIAQLSKLMVEKGYKGFEGLTDLPGTVAAAVYGNCGCRGCSVNELVDSFTIMIDNGEIITLTPKELNCSYRSTSLKRKELDGVILSVILKKNQGCPEDLRAIMKHNHQIRLSQQPSASNNLGTTFNGGSNPTLKGLIFKRLEMIIGIFIRNNDPRRTFPILLKLTGNGRYIPYVYKWNRYMFLDEKAHDLFCSYTKLIMSLYKDARLEIEIRE